MSRDFLVTVTGERRRLFESVFESGTVYVTSPVPELAKLPNFNEPQLVYMLDVSALTSQQRSNLVSYLADKFNRRPADVERDLDEDGMPILAEGCLVCALTSFWGAR